MILADNARILFKVQKKTLFQSLIKGVIRSGLAFKIYSGCVRINGKGIVRNEQGSFSKELN